MPITVAGKDYTDSELAIVAVPAEYSRHPPGTITHQAPCSSCRITCLIDGRSREIIARTGRPVICLRCAYHRFPDMVCGSRDGRPVTIREWFDNAGDGTKRNTAEDVR